MTTYKMTTISSNTRIRDQHNTLGNVLASVGANVQVTGDELFTASVTIGTPTVYQQQGDIWMRVSYNGVTGWMAFKHLGQPICKDLIYLPVDPPVPPVVVYEKPEYVIWETPDGVRTRYNKGV